MQHYPPIDAWGGGGAAAVAAQPQYPAMGLQPPPQQQQYPPPAPPAGAQQYPPAAPTGGGGYYPMGASAPPAAPGMAMMQGMMQGVMQGAMMMQQGYPPQAALAAAAYPAPLHHQQPGPAYPPPPMAAAAYPGMAMAYGGGGAGAGAGAASAPPMMMPMGAPLAQAPPGQAAALPHPARAPPGGAVAVVGAAYCHAAPLDLVLQEGARDGLGAQDAFVAYDAAGRPLFKQHARAMSLTDKRVLFDATGSPVVGMAKKLVALKATWVMYGGGDFQRQVAVVKADWGLKPSMSVFLNDGDSEADFKVKGDFRAKKFDVTLRLPNGKKREVAGVRKESRFASAGAFARALMTDADRYFVHIEAGVDAAFIVALAALADEMFNDSAQG